MEHDHGEEKLPAGKIITAATMLITGLLLQEWDAAWFQNTPTRLVFYGVAYAFVALPVVREAWEWAVKGDIFSEFMLMTIATIGAFAIGEYPEAVAVMLLYCIGEAFQDRAVDRARDNIEALIKLRPTKVRRVTNHLPVAEESPNTGATTVEADPDDVKVGDIIEVRAGERVPLDGTLCAPSPLGDGRSETSAAFNTAALTGESAPRNITSGAEVLAGMIPTDRVVRLCVLRPASESAISRILKMVEEAAERKSPTELFIRKFAHVYTPTVIALAALTVLLPWIYTTIDDGFHYVFSEWFRRALVFLVISCPCALVISIPLTYFGGIGAGSKRGILFKGGNYLDAMTRVDTVVFDKTGTLTSGAFTLQKTVGLTDEDLQSIVAIEQNSNHPIAKAIVNGRHSDRRATIKDIAGHGIEGTVDGKAWLIGTQRLLDKHQVAYPTTVNGLSGTVILCACNGEFRGHIELADTPKADARVAVDALREAGVKRIDILSGDRQAMVDEVSAALGIDNGQGNLLPQDKVNYIEQLEQRGMTVAFVGDGINDAPVLALSSVGMAMGAMGSDVAIETADVIIQTDEPSKVAEALRLSRRTRTIVYQNIALAIGIKLLVMCLGLSGVATLWEAVFADSGVALLAVLNATRIFLKVKK